MFEDLLSNLGPSTAKQTNRPRTTVVLLFPPAAGGVRGTMLDSKRNAVSCDYPPITAPFEPDCIVFAHKVGEEEVQYMELMANAGFSNFCKEGKLAFANLRQLYSLLTPKLRSKISWQRKVALRSVS